LIDPVALKSKTASKNLHKINIYKLFWLLGILCIVLVVFVNTEERLT